MYPLITLSISHCFKCFIFHNNCFFLFLFFHSGTNWRERVLFWALCLSLEKFDISINNGKFVVCVCVCVCVVCVCVCVCVCVLCGVCVCGVCVCVCV